MDILPSQTYSEIGIDSIKKPKSKNSNNLNLNGYDLYGRGVSLEDCYSSKGSINSSKILSTNLTFAEKFSRFQELS
jgi:hypothetical protein